MTATPKSSPHVEVTSWGSSARRSYLGWEQADVLWEDNGTSTRGAWRGMGPSASTQSVEITSGSTIYQQGLAATCEDPSEEHLAKPIGGIWWGA